jgi:hypothetical protein
MLDGNYLESAQAKLHALERHTTDVGVGLIQSIRADLTLAAGTQAPPAPEGGAEAACGDPGCAFCLPEPEPEPEPEPDALDLVEPATEVIARLVERLMHQGDAPSLALAVEGLTLLRMTMGDYEPDGDGGDGDDGEPHIVGPSGLVVMVPGVYLRGRDNQPA